MFFIVNGANSSPIARIANCCMRLWEVRAHLHVDESPVSVLLLSSGAPLTSANGNAKNHR